MHWWIRLKLHIESPGRYTANQQRWFIKGHATKVEKWHWLLKKTGIKQHRILDRDLDLLRKGPIYLLHHRYINPPHSFAHRQFHWNLWAYNYWSYVCKVPGEMNYIFISLGHNSEARERKKKKSHYFNGMTWFFLWEIRNIINLFLCCTLCPHI